MTVSRRDFLRTSCAVGLGFAGLQAWTSCTGSRTTSARNRFGPLQRDPARVLDLPTGFRYTTFSQAGTEMDDGLFVPGFHDGMGAFEGPNGTTIIVRNHELPATVFDAGPFGHEDERLSRVDVSKLYDQPDEGRPPQGGTTTAVFDTKNQTLVSQHLSLAGTSMNCSGGPTPWGTWISCEETTFRSGLQKVSPELSVHFAKDHGYAFEIPAVADGGLVRAEPLRAMGRFMHEAAAVHARTGIVYLTEDREDGLLYRFLPEQPGALARGGRLQALALRDLPMADTSNGTVAETPIQPRTRFATRWIDLDDVEAPEDDLRKRGHGEGAAIFRRGEGMWAAREELYFACTLGGPKELGQVWRYEPSPFEGTPAESRQPGSIELFVEPRDKNLLSNSDNLSITPWGDLIVCEDHVFPDGIRNHHLIGITPEGEIYDLARNVGNTSEMAGCVFSPDGSTLFVNIQRPGVTLAITGPWPAK